MVNRTANDGKQGVICPQALPEWLAQLRGSSGMTQGDTRTSEDCLFLDVVVPQDGFHAREEKGIMPVLVWIYGGGFVFGDKSAMVSNLLREAKKNCKGMVFVAMNYRLGLFGWLSGLQSRGFSNAGLYDQRLALHWVQDNIHLFGGDPNQVTVMGESAGGSSIMHQITAFGGIPPDGTPFQKAILQSPAFAPIPSSYEQENIFQNFLNTANVSTIEEARNLSSEQLQIVNQAMVADAAYGGFVFGPVVDSLFSTGLPGKLLLQGAYDPSLSLMLSHNSNEGAIFVNPNTTSNNDIYVMIRNSFPTIQPREFNHLIQDLYPPIFNDTTGKYPYANNFERASLIYAEAAVTCNTNYLARAYDNQTYNYIFSVPPGIHGEDVPYTFYVPQVASPNVTSVVSDTGESINSTVATALQDYITTFAATGNPNADVRSLGEGETAWPQFETYGESGRAMILSEDGIGMGSDPARDDARCLWWQRALYY